MSFNEIWDPQTINLIRDFRYGPSLGVLVANSHVLLCQVPSLAWQFFFGAVRLQKEFRARF